MKRLLKLFKKKQFNNNNNSYEKMGTLGVSPHYVLMYQQSIKKINEDTR